MPFLITIFIAGATGAGLAQISFVSGVEEAGAFYAAKNVLS